VLGAGFLEKVDERALLRELALRGVSANWTGSTCTLDANRSCPVISWTLHYRVSDRLYSAAILKAGLGEAKLLATADAIRDAH